MKGFPNRLQSALKENNETAYSLSKKTGVSEATIGRLLKGANRPAETTIRILADGLGITYDWLATGEGDKKLYEISNTTDTNILKDESTIGGRLEMFIKEKGIDAQTLSTRLGVSFTMVWKFIYNQAQPSFQVIENLLSAYPELSADWLMRGVGYMIKPASSNALPLGLSHPTEDHEGLEIIKRENGTEFRYLGEEKYLMVTPLVDQFAYAGYTMGWSDHEYIEELPRHAIVVDRLHFGIYRSFIAKGDSMDNGKRGSIADGDILTGRRIDKRHWRNKLHLHKYQDYVIHTVDGIMVKRIKAHDVNAGIITYESLNPDKKLYPDAELSLSEVVELYNIVAKTEMM